MCYLTAVLAGRADRGLSRATTGCQDLRPRAGADFHAGWKGSGRVHDGRGSGRAEPCVAAPPPQHRRLRLSLTYRYLGFFAYPREGV